MAGFINLGKYGWVTRDCPNDILPALSDDIGLFAATAYSWAWPANYLEAIAATANEFLLTNLYVNPALGRTVIVNGSSYNCFLVQYQIATGAAASEVNVAEGYVSIGFYMSVSGKVLDTISVSVLDNETRTARVYPARIPTGSRLSVRATVSGAPTLKSGGLFLSGYDMRVFDVAHAPAFDDLFMRGLRPGYPMCRPAAGAVDVVTASYAYGAWTSIIASIEEDCLVDKGMAAAKAGDPVNSCQIELGLGPDNTHVTIQDRYAIASVGTREGSADCEFPLPFIAYKGEQMWARAADTNGALTVAVGVHATRLT